MPWVDYTGFRSTDVEGASIMDVISKKSNAAHLSKLADSFDPVDLVTESDFKKPFNAKKMSQLELYLKYRSGPLLDSYKGFTRKPSDNQKTLYQQDDDENEECPFCQIYDENAARMVSVVESKPVHASVVRFNSDQIAILFSDRGL